MSALAGRAALVTGASQGLGLAVARAYVAEGASVALCARGAAELERSRAELAAACNPAQRVFARVGDVARPDDCRDVVAATVEALGRIDVLVNNAGVYGPMGPIETVDWAEWARAIEINVFGTVLMCREVLPHMKGRRSGKIVNLSGGGATNPLPNLSAYATSKAAVVRFTETLALEVAADGVDVNAIAPGALNTRLLDQVLAAGPTRVGERFYERALQQKKEGGTPPERGAALAVFLASAASDGITGRLLSAVWDPWESLAAHKAELDTSDVYTLRRIVPKDRGQAWGERA